MSVDNSTVAPMCSICLDRPGIVMSAGQPTCLDCASLLGGGIIENPEKPGTGAVLETISRGSPCLCGPGFCARSKGLGYFGYCDGSRVKAASDCPECGAPHQSTAGCWCCKGTSSPSVPAFTLRCLTEGVEGHEVFDAQNAAWARGESCDLDRALDIVLAARTS